MTDRTDLLRQAAQARHASTLRRAEDTLRILRRRGDPVTFRGFAQSAGVSRSWLYRQPQLREELDKLRQQPAQTPGVPARQAATAESRLQQIQTYRAEIARLRAENQALHEKLARQLGTARADAATQLFGDMSTT